MADLGAVRVVPRPALHRPVDHPGESPPARRMGATGRPRPGPLPGSARCRPHHGRAGRRAPDGPGVGAPIHRPALRRPGPPRRAGTARDRVPPSPGTPGDPALPGPRPRTTARQGCHEHFPTLLSEAETDDDQARRLGHDDLPRLRGEQVELVVTNRDRAHGRSGRWESTLAEGPIQHQLFSQPQAGHPSLPGLTSRSGGSARRLPGQPAGTGEPSLVCGQRIGARPRGLPPERPVWLMETPEGQHTPRAMTR